MAEMRPTRRFHLRLIAVACATLAGYLVVEVGYRVYTYHRIRDLVVTSTVRQLPANTHEADMSKLLVSNSEIDLDTGFRYRPNITVRTDGAFPIAWQTNSHGHIARGEYPVAKPPDEFRIGLVGDSFTANVTNTIRWGDVLEDRLNASPAAAAMTGGRRVRVINFGLDGIGVVQFDDVAVKMAVPFGIDLLVVNILREDVGRRPYFRGALTPRSEEELAAQVDAQLLSKLPFWSIYPEVFAATIGRTVGMRPRLTVQEGAALLAGPRRYDTPEEAAAASAAAVRRLRCHFGDAVFLVHPHYNDRRGREDPFVVDAFDRFARVVDEVELVDMSRQLPTPSSDAEWDSWYNMPYDPHNSDLGLRLYGETVAAYLLRRSAQTPPAAQGPPCS
jgi:hypothetical protein